MQRDNDTCQSHKSPCWGVGVVSLDFFFRIAVEPLYTSFRTPTSAAHSAGPSGRRPYCIYVIRIHHGMANDGTPQYSQLSEPAVHPFHSGMGGASRPREPRRRRRGGEYLNIRPFNYQLSA